MEIFEYDIAIKAKSPEEAFIKLTAASVIIDKLDTESLVKMSETVNNPIKLAAAKIKLGL